MFSRVVRRPYPLVSPPLTMLIRVRIWNASFVTSNPATFAVPEVGSRRVARILMTVVFPAPFGPSNPNSSPSWISRSTPPKAVTGPSEPPFSAFLRRKIFFRTEKTRVSAFVSTACAMMLSSNTTGACPHARGVGRSRDGQLLAPGHVAGDSVAHHGRGNVRQLRDFHLVVREVLREHVRMEAEELEGDALDVRRPNVPHGCTWFRGLRTEADSNRY